MSDARVSLIVAGGSGIGAAIARELAARGDRVGILSSSGKGEALANELGGVGVTGSNLDPVALAELVDKATTTWGRLDCVVNGAGHGPKGDILEISDEDWHHGADVYLLNVIRMSRLATPWMERTGSGAFVNVSTFAAFEPDPMFPTSGVFRAALASFTKLFADRYASQNIRMNNILPGFVDSLPEKPERRDRIPMGRYGTAAEIAKTAAFLLSDDGAYITGQNLRVDGGLTRSV